MFTNVSRLFGLQNIIRILANETTGHFEWSPPTGGRNREIWLKLIDLSAPEHSNEKKYECSVGRDDRRIW
jgi:hypothetical protein